MKQFFFNISSVLKTHENLNMCIEEFLSWILEKLNPTKSVIYTKLINKTVTSQKTNISSDSKENNILFNYPIINLKPKVDIYIHTGFIAPPVGIVTAINLIIYYINSSHKSI